MTLLDQFSDSTRGLFPDGDADKSALHRAQSRHVTRRIVEWKRFKARQARKRRIWAAVAFVSALILMVFA